MHDELDIHVRQTYNDPKRSELLPDMRGLKHLTTPGVKFHLGPIKEKYVDELIRRVRIKSAPGGDVVSYKVFKYCDRLRHILF